MQTEHMITSKLLNHWEFERLPFPKLVSLEDTFIYSQFGHALGRLEQVVITREVGVVVGEAGTGKSTLLNLFMEQNMDAHYRIIHIPLPQSKQREFYRSISNAMGVNTTLCGADAIKVAELLRYSYVESNRPNVLVVDEAHNLTPNYLNQLRLLTNITVKNQSMLTLLLFGQPALASTLKLPDMIPLAQRISAWINLDLLTEKEAIDYIDWQVAQAGAKTSIFAPAVKLAIYRRAQGNPRLINRLAWEALNQACLDNSEVVTEEIFSYTCKHLGPHLAS